MLGGANNPKNEEEGSTWDFLPDFSDYVPDISGPTAQGLFGALANFGGIAGALATGGPQAMTAFVNRIAESQQLELSREWEAFQKNEDKAFTLHRDRLQREHEERITEKKEAAIEKRLTGKGVNALLGKLNAGGENRATLAAIAANTAGVPELGKPLADALESGDQAEAYRLGLIIHTNIGGDVASVEQVNQATVIAKSAVESHLGKGATDHLTPPQIRQAGQDVVREKEAISKRRADLSKQAALIRQRLNETSEEHEIRVLNAELNVLKEKFASEGQRQSEVKLGAQTLAAGEYSGGPSFPHIIESSTSMEMWGDKLEALEGTSALAKSKLNAVKLNSSSASFVTELRSGVGITSTAAFQTVLPEDDGTLVDPATVQATANNVTKDTKEVLGQMRDTITLASENNISLSQFTFGGDGRILQALTTVKRLFSDSDTGQLYPSDDPRSLENAPAETLRAFADAQGDLSSEAGKQTDVVASGVADALDSIVAAGFQLNPIAIQKEFSEKFESENLDNSVSALSRVTGVDLSGIAIGEKDTMLVPGPNVTGGGFTSKSFRDGLKQQRTRKLIPETFLKRPEVAKLVAGQAASLPEGYDPTTANKFDRLAIAHGKLNTRLNRAVEDGLLTKGALGKVSAVWYDQATKYVNAPDDGKGIQPLVDLGVLPQRLVAGLNMPRRSPDTASTDARIARVADVSPLSGVAATLPRNTIRDDYGHNVVSYDDFVEGMKGSPTFRAALEKGTLGRYASAGIGAPGIRMPTALERLPSRGKQRFLLPTYETIFGERPVGDHLHKIRVLEAALSHEITPELGTEAGGPAGDAGSIQKLLDGVSDGVLIRRLVGDPNMPGNQPTGLTIGTDSLDDLVVEEPEETHSQNQIPTHEDNVNTTVAALGSFATLKASLPAGTGYAINKEGKITAWTPGLLAKTEQALANAATKAQTMLTFHTKGQELQAQQMADLDGVGGIFLDVNGKTFVALDPDGHLDAQKTEDSFIKNVQTWGKLILGAATDPVTGQKPLHADIGGLVNGLENARSYGEHNGNGITAMIRLTMQYLKNNSKGTWQRHSGSVSTTSMNIPKDGETYVIGELHQKMQERWEGIMHLAVSPKLRNLQSSSFKDEERMPLSVRKIFNDLSMEDPSGALVKAVLYDQYYPGPRQPKEER